MVLRTVLSVSLLSLSLSSTSSACEQTIFTIAAVNNWKECRSRIRLVL
jgi:hypothetical protein